MQRIANYGSFLQAYALRKLLEKRGCEVQFVDYVPGKTLIPPDGTRSIARKINKAKEAFTYGAPLAQTFRFISYKKNYAKKYYPLLGLTEKPNIDPQVDVLVIGSDEVFNCVQNNVNVGYTPALFGVDVNTKKIISYAASFGNTTLEKLKEHGKDEEVGRWLQENFSALSLRDQNSYDIVTTLTNKPAEIHLDPVLTYDFAEEKERAFKRPDYKYMIVYGYSGRFSDAECREIRNYAQRNNLKIINIGGIQKCCDEFVDCEPLEVIQYFKNAECVVTDTFHGTILSIINHCNFAVYVREKGYGNSQKLSDLLKRVKQEDRIVGDYASTILGKEPDYTETDAIIRTYREKAAEYFEKNLNI